MVSQPVLFFMEQPQPTMEQPQPKIGRPKKEVKEINPQVQFGRRQQSDVDLVDAAAQAAGKSRAEWAWEILLRAARRAVKRSD